MEFQWSGHKASASFAEVDGLEHELVFDGNEESAKIEFPKSIKMRHVILKRALEPVNEKVTVWVKHIPIHVQRLHKTMQHDHFPA